MRHNLTVVCPLALVACLLGVVFGPTRLPSQEKRADKGSIVVAVGGSSGTITTVTVYQAGKRFATNDVSGTARFSNLPAGDYEVHFEAPGKVTVTKRCTLRADEKVELLTNMKDGKGALVLGGGPSIQDLESRIEKLEKEVEAIKRK